MKNDRVADVVSYPAKKNSTLLEMISFDVKPAHKVYIYIYTQKKHLAYSFAVFVQVENILLILR